MTFQTFSPSVRTIGPILTKSAPSMYFSYTSIDLYDQFHVLLRKSIVKPVETNPFLEFMPTQEMYFNIIKNRLREYFLTVSKIPIS